MTQDFRLHANVFFKWNTILKKVNFFNYEKKTWKHFFIHSNQAGIELVLCCHHCEEGVKSEGQNDWRTLYKIPEQNHEMFVIHLHQSTNNGLSSHLEKRFDAPSSACMLSETCLFRLPFGWRQPSEPEHSRTQHDPIALMIRTISFFRLTWCSRLLSLCLSNLLLPKLQRTNLSYASEA